MVPAEATSELAINGGKPVRVRRFPSWPHFSDDEIAAVTEVMRSGRVNYWTGEQCGAFEEEFAAACGCKHAIAVTNGTIALELALRALGIGPGDEVITSSRTFIASASCISMCGATPVFADVDPDSQNVSFDTFRAVLSKKTRALIAVHLAGWPCEMSSIVDFARDHNLFVIEDCAQAQGAKSEGRLVGSFGDIAAFSFCQDKIMTTLGEGGMITTNNRSLWEKVWALKDHGKNPISIHQKSHTNGFRWMHDCVGTNARITEAQAAVGRAQLRKVPEWLKKRRSNASMLSAALSAISALRVPVPDSTIEHAWYRLYVFVCPDELKDGWSRDRIMSAIEAEGVPCYAGSCSEVYLEKAFAGGCPRTRLPVARELGETSLAFLVHPTLLEEDIQDTCAAVEKVMRAAATR